MVIRAPAPVSTPVKRGLLNWSPRSVSKIEGRPNCAIAPSIASMQTSASMVFDGRHARTRRPDRSMIATGRSSTGGARKKIAFHDEMADLGVERVH